MPQLFPMGNPKDNIPPDATDIQYLISDRPDGYDFLINYQTPTATNSIEPPEGIVYTEVSEEEWDTAVADAQAALDQIKPDSDAINAAAAVELDAKREAAVNKLTELGMTADEIEGILGPGFVAP